MSEHVMPPQYVQYLESPWWRRRRSAYRDHTGCACEVCGQTSVQQTIDVHHLSYDHMYAERDDDLKTLCRRCHDVMHHGGIIDEPRPIVCLTTRCLRYDWCEELGGTCHSAMHDGDPMDADSWAIQFDASPRYGCQNDWGALLAAEVKP